MIFILFESQYTNSYHWSV